MTYETKVVKANQVDVKDEIQDIGNFRFATSWTHGPLIVNKVRVTSDGINHFETSYGSILALSSDWNIRVKREVPVKQARYYFKNNPSVLYDVAPSSQLWRNASVVIEEDTGKVLKS